MDEKKYTKEELIEILTEKQRIFCHEYIIDWNATRSAKVAGYSENSAYQIGSENLTKLEIKAYIELIKNNITEEAGISKLSQVNTLKEIVNDDDSSPRDKISATAELNKMLGFYEPDKIDVSDTRKIEGIKFDE